MRPVGVHLADQIGVISGQRALQAFDVRPPEPALAGAMDHVDTAGKLTCQPIGNLTGAIGRSVVDYHDGKQRIGQHGTNQIGQVVALVVVGMTASAFMSESWPRDQKSEA